MVEGTVLKDKYNIIKEIGSGSFGKVYMAEDIETKEKFAIKRIPAKELEDNEYLLAAFWKELDVMKKCECENSVRLVENFQSSNFYNIVMELCDTDLENVLNKRSKGFSEEEVQTILKQLNNVFAIMGKGNIIHRDLKLRNILVIFHKNLASAEAVTSSLNFVSKLSDFGFSKVMDEDITKTKLGTPATMAPEILMNKTYTKKADLWSIGVITYQLLFRTLPFRAKNEKELLSQILNSKGMKIPEGYKISDCLQNLLQSLLQIDPKDRISWKQYFEHPFFNCNVSLNASNTQATLPFEERYVSIRKLSEEFSEYTISKAKDKLTGQFVQIKEILRKIVDSQDSHKKIFQKEIELMNTLKGDCFIKLVDMHTTSSHYYIVTEHFEGKILENFLLSRKCLHESLVKQIIRGLAPAFKELCDNNIILEYISTKSFCFKYFKSEENFQIKFFDYGLSILFTDEITQREYLLTEAKLGMVNSQKTNILSLGMMIYKLLFGEPIYKFNADEDPTVTIKTKKSIKLPKTISKNCKHLIEKCCHQNKDKRYDWKAFLEDSFVKIQYPEDIKNTSRENDVPALNSINDYKIENLAENLKMKTEMIIQYFTSLFNEKLVELEDYKKYFKEMSIFTMLVVLEAKLFQEFLKSKKKFFEDEELHLMKISMKGSYEYCWINFQKNNIVINKENPMIESYLKAFGKLEARMIEIVSTIMKQIYIDVDEVKSYDYIANSMKNYYSANIEKYFFKVFENGIMHYTQNEYKEALNDFLISKYVYESIIFIRVIASNKAETTPFFQLFECIENDDEINLFSNENKLKNNQMNMENMTIFTFLGGIIKNFKSQKILEEDITSEILIENSNEAFDSLIKFYPEIIKLLCECSKTI